MERWHPFEAPKQMIRQIFSSLPSFKTLHFADGLNVLLSDKTDMSTQKQTRNSAGKSSVVEIIHFLLGSEADSTSIFRHEALAGHEFGMDFDLAGVTVGVTRSCSAPGKVKILYLLGDLSQWVENPFSDSTEIELTNKAWKDLLGNEMFRIPSFQGDDSPKYRPTFRSLFSYFARRQAPGGFIDTNRHAEKQQPWDQQVMLAYLLGLDWRLVGEFQILRDREKALMLLRKAAATEFSELVGKASDLLGELADVEERVAKRRIDVESFHVLPTHHEFLELAEKLSRELSEIRLQDQADRRAASDLATALEREEPPRIPDVRKLYSEVQVVLPDLALKTFDDVQAFHDSVIRNRRSYLETELGELRQRIVARAEATQRIDGKRAEAYRMLQLGGALDELTVMQIDLASKEAQAASLRNRYDAAKELESTKAIIDVERAQLVVRLQRDLIEREAAVRTAILIISRVISELYEVPGRVRIDPTSAGLDISVRLDGDRGKGINQMTIFAFDVMLSTITALRKMGPGFLVHDSHVFDGVDQRQRAAALMTGKKSLEAVGWQYIVLMNSDELPTDDNQPIDFDIESNILPIRFTDETETGGLFGIRF